MARVKESDMAKRYRALIGMSHPDSAAGCKLAAAIKFDETMTESELATTMALNKVVMVRTEIGEEVPAYVIAASPWLITEGKVEEIVDAKAAE
jgi:hypothetical protein